MIKFNLALFIVCTIFIAHRISRYVALLEQRHYNRLRAVYDNYQAARERRLTWLKTHQYLPQPQDHPDYEELWLEEIGAEMLIFTVNEYAHEISYDEYVREKRELYDQSPFS